MFYLALGYGLFNILGGIMGYIQKHSMVSLIMGVISGLLVLLFCGMLWKQQPLGYYGVLVISGLLTATFIWRFLQTHAIMPAGVILLFSLIVLVAYLLNRPAFLQTP